MKAERAWAYAMQLKDDAATNSRVRSHMHRRLAKAVLHAQHLEKICNARANQKTILEAEVRCSLLGIVTLCSRPTQHG